MMVNPYQQRPPPMSEREAISLVTDHIIVSMLGNGEDPWWLGLIGGRQGIKDSIISDKNFDSIKAREGLYKLSIILDQYLRSNNLRLNNDTGRIGK